MNFLGGYKYVVDFLVIAALVCLAALGVHKYNDYQQGIGEARVQQQWDKEHAAQAQATAKATADAAAKTAALQTAIDTQRSQANAQITALNSSLASAIAGLRERPARPSGSGLPEAPGAGRGCYPSQLYREDSTVAIQLAGEADKLRIALGACQAAYSSARKAVNGAP